MIYKLPFLCEYFQYWNLEILSCSNFDFVVEYIFLQSYSNSNSQLESTTASQTKFTSYNNTEFGISFDYPSNRESAEETNGFHAVIPDVKVTSPDNFNILLVF